MEVVFEIAGTTRQAFHKWQQPSVFEQKRTSDADIVKVAKEVRKNYLPGSGSRVVYQYIRAKLPEQSKELIGCGRHRFESVCLANGLRIEFHRFIPKTTERGDFIFDNQVAGMELNDINMVWVCDISYIFSHEGKLIGYSIAIIDLYSKRILGLHFSKTMHAHATVQIVLEQALKVRGITKYKLLFFHTDGGKQFIEGNFLATLKRYDIRSSMAECCYENASAEAFNDTLKNHMLNEYILNSFSQLKQVEKKLEYCYNYNKPHTSLAGRTPVEFEQEIQNLPISQRPIIKVAHSR